MRNKIRPDPVQIWMLEATNDDLCQHAWSRRWAVHSPVSSSGPSGPSCASCGGIYAPGIQREEIEKLVRYLSVIDADLLGADAKLLADALELQVESLYRTTTLTLAAMQRIAESQAAYLDGIISSIAATMFLTPRESPDEPRCRSDAACTGDAIMPLWGGNNVADSISKVHAELNDIAIDLMGTWFRTAQRFL
jgi:hypothetical protein